MAGFVLVPLAAVLVMAILLVIERGRVARLDVLEPGDCDCDWASPRPWNELDEYGWLDDAYQDQEGLERANDEADLDDRIQLGDHDALREDSERRHAATMAAYADSNAVWGRRPKVGTTTAACEWDEWDNEWDAAGDACSAAYAGSRWASARWSAVLYRA